jgi:4-phospho-D-threonate 3-dehydrogenase / 4-phospho-D-erythronate 3-dehydrogenase
MPNAVKELPTLGITMGDPAGIGAEIIVKALADPDVARLAHWIVVGDARILDMAARLAGSGFLGAEVRSVPVLGPLDDFRFGVLSGQCGAAALEYIRIATLMCLEGQARGMVTAPVNKEAVTLSGHPFTGHTEYIAQLCGATESRMLLASARLATVHVTTHRPLRAACDVDTGRVLRTLELGFDAMRRLGFDRPRIAVCGLNPHAGEHGLFGSEEEHSIIPAIDAARARGMDVSGPHAGDAIFLKAWNGAYDLVVAMYHDQGHIPMKLLDFEGAVNITLGIPIVRTSVDHGTAFDIAGRNLAGARNLKEAMRMAAKMACNSH